MFQIIVKNLNITQKCAKKGNNMQNRNYSNKFIIISTIYNTYNQAQQIALFF